MLDENFSSDWYEAILGNLRDNEYLTQKDVDILMRDSPVLANVGDEKAEMVRKALLKNSLRKSK